MTHQATADTALQDEGNEGNAGSVTVPDVALRIAGAMLALAVAAVHVADQGGVTAFTSPDWIGWSYRLIEVGGVLTALVLLLPRPARLAPAWTGWAAGVLLGAGPFAAFILTRTVGLPGETNVVGHWANGVGPVSLFVEAALVVLSVTMLLALRQFAVPGALRDLPGRARPAR